jgi:hypothetical protein
VKETFDQRVKKIANSNKGTPNKSPAEQSEARIQAAKTGQPAPSTTPSVTPEIAATPGEPLPPTVMELKAESPDGDVVLRSRNEKGEFAAMDRTKKFELSVRDKQTGETKVYEKDLDGLMRLAKDGIATQRFQDEVKRSAGELEHYRKNLPTWQQEYADMKKQAETVGTSAKEFQALAMQLLTADENTVVQLRNQYAAEMSPEKLRARDMEGITQERKRLEQERQTIAFERQRDTVRSAIGPVISQVEQMVGQEMATGKLMRDTLHLMENGIIPPKHLPQLIDYVNGPYKQWAESVKASQTTQSTQTQTQDTAKEAELLRQRQESQRLANLAGSAIRPVGQSGPDVAPKVPAKNAQDMIDRIIRSRPQPAMGR